MIPIHLFIAAFFLSIVDKIKAKKDYKTSFNQYARVDIVAGKTGSGKSFSALNEMINFKKRYPEGIIFSNMAVSLVNAPLSLDVFYTQYDVPVLIVVDEANSTYRAQLKSDIPKELRDTLMQIRKGIGKRVILLTQDYTLLDTSFRKLAHYVYETKTYFGRLTSYRRFEQQTYEAQYSSGGIDFDKSAKKLRRHSFWLLQTAKVRAMYDFKAVVDTDWHV